MLVRPGRLLPSVIVGALVTGALALGAGTAAADPIGDILGANECRDPETGATRTLIPGLLEKTANDLCEVVRTTTPTTPPETETPADTNDDGESAGGGGGGLPDPDGIVDGVTGGNGGTGSTGGNGSTTDQPGNTTGNITSGGSAPAPVFIPRPSALPAPDVRGGVIPNANLLSPGGAYGGLLATTPALGFGTFDPSLLLAPAGSPLRTLTGVDEGSPVTTVSDVQAMAFDNLPGGLGMPAVTGVLILSAFAAFALRHRVLHRARMAADAGTDTESEADTAEIPAREPVG